MIAFFATQDSLNKKNKNLKINFCDWFNNFEDCLVFKILRENFNAEVSSDPDIIFYSDYGTNFLKYDCVRVFVAGENTVPDFNLCDYAFSYHYINFNDRHTRLPLSYMSDEYKSLYSENRILKNISNKKFCNFIYSNQVRSDSIRSIFFEELCKYKIVDSSGKLHNNCPPIGPLREDKIKFLSNYKFTIAFENSDVDGYTTEKIIDPLVAGSIPIYWGNCQVARDFNHKSFLVLKDRSITSIQELIQKMKEIDINPYLEKKILEEPPILENQFIDSERVLIKFFDKLLHCFEKSNFRRSSLGYHTIYLTRFSSTPSQKQVEKYAHLCKLSTLLKIILKKIMQKF